MSATNQAYYGWETLFALLKRFGFAPRSIVDVGANRGDWTRTARAHFPAAEFLLVEPQAHLRAHVADLLQTGRVRWVTAGAGDRAGNFPLTIAPHDVSSNFGMTPEAAAAHGYPQTMVEVHTLDEIVRRAGVPLPEMVKIDAEGFDLKVLDGAPSLIGRTDIFFLEAAVCATGIENTMAAVIARMTQLGYRMIDITDLNRSPKHGVLWLCELAFMRVGCPLLEKVSSYQ
ncbi:MAG TPA: FkbM family methyltransferase [Opitutaceae bacterium]|nr:FkbM family methyltransferase [Opitutaceae bacterium]